MHPRSGTRWTHIIKKRFTLARNKRARFNTRKLDKTMVVTSTLKDLGVEMSTLHKLVVPRTRELKGLGIVRNPVEPLKIPDRERSKAPEGEEETSHPPPDPSQKEKQKGSWILPREDSTPPLKKVLTEESRLGSRQAWKKDIGKGKRRTKMCNTASAIFGIDFTA